MVIVVVIVGSDDGGVVLVWSGLMVEVGSGSESCGCEYCGGVGGVGCFTFCRVQRTVLRVDRVQSNSGQTDDIQRSRQPGGQSVDSNDIISVD